MFEFPTSNSFSITLKSCFIENIQIGKIFESCFFPQLKHELAASKKQSEILERNLLLLYKTANHIITLKDKELNNLRTK